MQPFLPEPLKEGLELYVKHGIEPGGFMQAVLRNDLYDAVARADRENSMFLSSIVSYFANNIPNECWGSPAAYDRWVQKRQAARLKGADEEAE